MIIVPPEASLGHWQNVLETSHSMSLLPYPTSRWDRGGVELTLWHPPDICTAEALVHFQRLHGLTSFLLIYGQEMVLYGASGSEWVRWIETHFCCSLSCWQMAFPSHRPAFPSCHLSFWRGHWFPRVLRFFDRSDVSPALSLLHLLCQQQKGQLHGHQPEATNVVGISQWQGRDTVWQP